MLLYGMLFFVTLAVLPAVILLIYIYRQDKIEKEPIELLMNLILRGVLAGFLSMFLENIGTMLLDSLGLDQESPLYMILLAFLVVGLIEEGTKYYLMHRKVWNNPNFNFRFDGIVYAVFTSLGFAGMENILYALGYGPSVLFSRAILSIPGHMGFAVVFGYYYGRARLLANRGAAGSARAQIIKGYVMAVFLHGLYDACAMIGSGASMLVFLGVVVCIYILVFHTVRKESKSDIPLYGGGTDYNTR